jgi:hypothetical protein
MFGFGGSSKEEISQEEHQLYCEVDFWERKKDYGATDEEIEEAYRQIEILNDKIRDLRWGR